MRSNKVSKLSQGEEDIDSRNFSSADFDRILHSHIILYFPTKTKKLMQCNKDESTRQSWNSACILIHFHPIFPYILKSTFHNDIASALVDEDSLEALGLLSDHVPHHHQPIQTQYYYIALLERSPLVPHTYYGGRHHQSNKICEDEKGRPRRLESNSKIVDSRLWTGLVQLSDIRAFPRLTTRHE